MLLSADQPASTRVFHSLDNLHDTSFRLAFRLPELSVFTVRSCVDSPLGTAVPLSRCFWRRVR